MQAILKFINQAHKRQSNTSGENTHSVMGEGAEQKHSLME
jgi:hypothetical protein